MSGGKGGSTSSSVTVPEYIEKAAQRNLNKAERISQTGYTPYYGPDVAAFSPMQQASFQNTANVANAFGMGAPTSQQDIMGGMPPPTQYAGGVSGYSSAPLYEQSLDQLGLNRPAQKAHIDSFFINPYTGQPGSNAPAPIDYNAYPTYEEMQRNIAAENSAAQASALVAGDNEGREANEGGGQGPSGSALSNMEMSDYANTIAGNRDAGYGTVRPYNPSTDVLSQQEQDYVTGPNGADARLAQEDIAMNATGTNQIGFLDELGMLQNREPSFNEPSGGSAYFNRFPDENGNPTRNGYNSTGGSYGGSLVTGGLSGNLTGLPEVSAPGFIGGIADNIYAATDFEGAVDAQSQNFANSAKGFDPNRYAMFDVNTPTANQKSAREASIAQAAAQRDQDADNRAQLMEKASATRAGVGSNAYTSVEDRKGSQGYTGSTGGSKSSNAAGGGGGTQSNCVIATHAVASGGFSPSSKREAVIWCVNVLHGKWWGEAIRRGYRHLGVKKIEQGKAHEHYAEFKNYIAFARGKNRTIKGALHFAARTAQFFVIGLVKKDI